MGLSLPPSLPPGLKEGRRITASRSTATGENTRYATGLFHAAPCPGMCAKAGEQTQKADSTQPREGGGGRVRGGRGKGTDRKRVQEVPESRKR